MAGCTAVLCLVSAGELAAEWSALGVGMNYNVEALSVDASGNLYAGGAFTTAGGVTAKKVAKWDGSAWSALGEGMDKTVYALAIDSVGNLYAGGDFTTAGGVSANRIAKWDGNTWSSLGEGMSSTVFAIAFDSSGNLYAGGYFTTAGGVAAKYLAKWNGSAWSALGEQVSGVVHSLAFDSRGGMLAGGGFVAAGPVTVNCVATWDGSSWAALGTGVGGSYPYVGVCCSDAAGAILVGGEFTTAGGVAAGLIARWDGKNWSALGSGMTGVDVRAIAPDGASVIYAGGQFSKAGGVDAPNVAKWDGGAWSGLGSGLDNGVSALVLHNGILYAGGGFSNAGGIAASRIARWSPPAGAYSISGGITKSGTGEALQGVTVSAGGGNTATTGSDGAYVISGLVDASYTITPSLSGYTFTPGTRSVTISGASLSGVDFIARSGGGGLKVTIGSRFDLTTTAVFDKKPKVRAAVGSGFKSAKILTAAKQFPTSTLSCEWTAKCSPGDYALSASGTVSKKKIVEDLGTISVVAPSIASLTPTTWGPGETVTVTGSNFGKKPKIWVTCMDGKGKVAKRPCKLQDCAFDTAVGTSSLTFPVPKFKDGDNSFTFWLSNQIGTTSYP